jgi:hypothetical protein
MFGVAGGDGLPMMYGGDGWMWGGWSWGLPPVRERIARTMAVIASPQNTTVARVMSIQPPNAIDLMRQEVRWQ